MDEIPYKVSNLVSWSKENNLSLNIRKTKELVIDFREQHTDLSPLDIEGKKVKTASDFKFLGVHILNDLTRTNNCIALVIKAQQQLYFLRALGKIKLPSQLLLSFKSLLCRESSY